MPTGAKRGLAAVLTLIVVVLGLMIARSRGNGDAPASAVTTTRATTSPFAYTAPPSIPPTAVPPPATPTQTLPAAQPSLSESDRTLRMVVSERECEDAVRDRLKAPATAEFSETSSVSDSANVPTFVVTGQVDAQNGFGALVRSSWTCRSRSDATDAEQVYLSDIIITAR